MAIETKCNSAGNFNQSIRPIETVYNGYRFRSRLEARWAVFFDSAGIEYQYEPEGFVLSDGTMYLPDFYLPWFRCYVEIKPKHSSQIELAVKTLSNLVEQHGNCGALLCRGEPYDDDIRLLCYDTTDGGGGVYDSYWGGDEPCDRVRFLEGIQWETDGVWHCAGKHFISLCVGENTDSKYRDYCGSSWGALPIQSARGMTCYRSDFDYAKTKARQARFEHGERGL
jgi:hypothetical protein